MKSNNERAFYRRLAAKIEQHLLEWREFTKVDDPEELVDLHIDANGKMIEMSLFLVDRYWNGVKPTDVDREAENHERALLSLVTKSKENLNLSLELLNKRLRFKLSRKYLDRMKGHFRVYETKILGEMSIYRAARLNEISAGRKQWLFNFVLPIVLSVFAIYWSAEAKDSLTEAKEVRDELMEMGKLTVLTSHLILDGAGRWGGMPAHKAAAYSRLKKIEDTLLPAYPDLKQEIKSLVEGVNKDATRLWNEYEKKEGAEKNEYWPEYIRKHRGF